MKKFYFFLTALLIGLAANAETYAVHGNFTGDWVSTDMTETGGVWSVSNIEVTSTNAEFGIKVMNGDEQTGWYAGYGSVTIQNDAKYQLYSSNTTNLKIGTGTYSFSFNPSNGVLTVGNGGSGEVITPEIPALAYAVHGSFTGGWASTDMTETDGVWSVSNIQVTSNSAEFGIKKMENGDQTAWYAATSATTISSSITLTLGDSNTSNIKISEGTYSMSFYPETSQLVINKAGGDTPQPGDATYYLTGVGGNWDAVTDYVFSANGDGTYSVTVSSVFGNVKITQGDWDKDSWGAEDPLTIGNTVDLTTATGKNITLGNGTETINNAVFTFDPTNLTVSLAGESGGEPEITYEIWGKFGENWASVAMTESTDGKWVASNVSVTNKAAEFGIRELANGAQSATGWFASHDDVTVEASTILNLTNSETKNIKIAQGTWNFSFNPDTLKLEITGTASGIADVEADVNAPAAYYNLQGQRVAEPKGIVIKVQNGKAVKMAL